MEILNLMKDLNVSDIEKYSIRKEIKALSERLNNVANKKAHLWNLIKFTLNENNKTVSSLFDFDKVEILDKNYSINTVLHRKSNKEKIALKQKSDNISLFKEKEQDVYTISYNRFMTSYVINGTSFIEFFDSDQLRIDSEKFDDIKQINKIIGEFKDLVDYFEDQSNLLEDYLHCHLDSQIFEDFVLGELNESSYETKNNWSNIKETKLSFPNLFGYMKESSVDEIRKDFGTFPFKDYKSIVSQKYQNDYDFKAHFYIYGEDIKMHDYYVAFEYWNPRADHFGYHGEKANYKSLTLKFFKKREVKNTDAIIDANKDIKPNFTISITDNEVKTVNTNAKEITNKNLFDVLSKSLDLLKRYEDKTRVFFE